jgi:hypothetical protein
MCVGEEGGRRGDVVDAQAVSARGRWYVRRHASRWRNSM